MSRIPVTVITGFLGAGKTTLIRHLLTHTKGKRLALIINEFGEIGVDHLLVETSTETMVELNNGCICCTIRGDLADKLGSLAMWMDARRIPPVERVIVETTGLADPAPIVHTMVTDPHLLARFRLGGVLTVVDAVAAASSLDRFSEAVKQVALADVLVVSKSDLVDALSDRASYADIRSRIGTINPRAVVLEVTRGEIEPGVLFATGCGSEATPFAEFARWFEPAHDCAAEAECDDPSCESSHEHRHEKRDTGITSFVISFEQPVESGPFNDFLHQLALEFGERLLRVKGLLHVKENPARPAVIQGVQHVFFPVSWLDQWPSPDRTSKLVFITQNLARNTVEGRFRERYT